MLLIKISNLKSHTVHTNVASETINAIFFHNANW